MKTFRQKLLEWVNSELSQPEITTESSELLNDIKGKLKEYEGYERDIINHAYDRGYYDSEQKRGRISCYYQTTYKITDIMKDILKRSREEQIQQ